MRIALWPTLYLPNIGGLEVMTHSLAKQLQTAGHEVIVIANHLNSDQFKEYTIEGVKVFLFPFITALIRADLAQMKKIMSQVHQLLDTFEADVVNVHGWFECFCFYQARILEHKKIPVCITIHGLLEQSHYRTDACLKLWSLAKAVNTVSQVLIRSLEECGIHHRNIKAVYNGLAVPKEPIKAVSITPPTLVMVGRLTREKCFNIAFYALKNLLQKHPDIKLILVGGGEDFHMLSKLKTELGLEKHIEMTDFVRPDQVQSYIDRASLVLVPSYYESFCLVALQAAMRGRPVIASNVYGLKELIEHNKTGLLIPSMDPDALSEAIDQLLSDPDTMREMGNAAYKRAVRLFNIENTTKCYIEMYEKILEQVCEDL